MKSDVSPERLSDNLDSRVSYTILTKINGLNKELVWVNLTDEYWSTYTKLLLQSDALSKGSDHFVCEVGVATEIERLELLKLA